MIAGQDFSSQLVVYGSQKTAATSLKSIERFPCFQLFKHGDMMVAFEHLKSMNGPRHISSLIGLSFISGRQEAPARGQPVPLIDAGHAQRGSPPQLAVSVLNEVAQCEILWVSSFMVGPQSYTRKISTLECTKQLEIPMAYTHSAPEWRRCCGRNCFPATSRHSDAM